VNIAETIAACRAARAKFGVLGLVPTMGFLHEGHLSLIRRAKAECGAVAVSLFVNPTQFAPHEDFARYPRALGRDLEMIEAAGGDLVFTPSAAEIYPPDFDTRIEVGAVSRRLEGAVRPVHFAGVATVVTKLFNILQPTKAYFGQKDAQQCVVIKALVRDLNLPLEVVISPTVREPDGLAMSSRNSYLNPEQRAAAPALYAALQDVAARYGAGERNAEGLRKALRDRLAVIPDTKIDYVSVADPDTLEELDQLTRGALVSLAVRFGATRLLDNVVLEG